ncbi:hypothetical protein [Paenibacillus xylanexedens]|uniref:hypothetical protein n=1 Tax=Paenibacillus xylanexedens TaxID=528191 RepID=UPI0011A42D7D|nr:hypothetical protein [Paenibacillus xylanexedens]
MGNLNRLGLLSQTEILSFQVQNFNIHVVKTNNPLQIVEKHFLYFLTHINMTMEGEFFEEVIDFFYTSIPDALWDYVLESHINNIEQTDDQLLEYLLHEVNTLIA